MAASVIAALVEQSGWNRLARARALPAQAQIAIAAGTMDTARAAVDELDAIATDFASAGLEAAALTARGRLQVAERDEAACSTLRRAVSRWSDLGVPYEVASARTLLGQACRDSDDAAGATAAFEDARKLFDDLGVRLDARLAASPAPIYPAGLTAREVEVLRLIAAGNTNKEAAAQLFLSDKTIARHLSNIFTKIGVSTRAAATAFAFEQGLIPRD